MGGLQANVVSITTFDERGRFDEKAYRSHLRRLASAGLRVFVAGEGVGEMLSMAASDVRFSLTVAAEELSGRVPFVALGYLPPNARAQIDFMSMAAECGFTTLGVYPLQAIHRRIPSEPELEAYYDAVIGATSSNVVLSCFTPAAPYVVGAELLGRIARRHENVIDIQCSGNDMIYMMQLINAVGPRVGVHSGGIDHALTNLALGGSGFVCAEANVVPQLAQSILDGYAARDHNRIHVGLSALLGLKSVHRKYGFVRTLKGILDGWGLPGGPVSPPMLPLPPDKMVAMRAEVEQLDLLALENDSGA